MLKLDFNERADSIPKWLQEFKLETKQLWKYPNRQELETVLAEKFNCDKEQLFVSNGGDESIELFFKLCQLNSYSVLLPLPAFSQYTHQLNIWSIKNTLIESRDDLSIDCKKVKNSIKAGQWLILTRPNNPTGECIAEDKLLDLIKSTKKLGAYVFLDEAYVEFFLEDSSLNYALEFDNVISLRTFSKAYGLAGARLGYLIGNAGLIAQFKKIAMPFNVNNLSLQVAKAALQNSDEMKAYCSEIAANRNIIYNFLKTNGVDVFDGRGNFLLFKLNNKKKQILISYLSKLNIQIKTSVNDLPNYVRITIPENIEGLLVGLRTVFNPEIIAFDMDGVLIDTSGSYDLCILQTVEYFTKIELSVENIFELRKKGGFNNDWDLTQGLIKQLGFESELTAVINKFQAYYQVNKSNEVNLLMGPELFEKSFMTAIITGRPRAEALDGVAQLQIQPEHIISADDVSEQKPSPQGINNLKINTQKSRLWFCGDTVDDMQAGCASNSLCIGIGENTENLYQAGADIVLNNINELSELL